MTNRYRTHSHGGTHAKMCGTFETGLLAQIPRLEGPAHLGVARQKPAGAPRLRQLVLHRGGGQTLFNLRLGEQHVDAVGARVDLDLVPVLDDSRDGVLSIPMQFYRMNATGTLVHPGVRNEPFATRALLGEKKSCTQIRQTGRQKIRSTQIRQMRQWHDCRRRTADPPECHDCHQNAMTDVATGHHYIPDFPSPPTRPPDGPPECHDCRRRSVHRSTRPAPSRRRRNSRSTQKSASASRDTRWSRPDAG